MKASREIQLAPLEKGIFTLLKNPTEDEMTARVIAEALKRGIDEVKSACISLIQKGKVRKAPVYSNVFKAFINSAPGSYTPGESDEMLDHKEHHHLDDHYLLVDEK